MSLKNIRPWIVSLRLRTLPLSASCIILGSVVAAYEGKFDTVVFTLALITTLMLQILSNLSNEYGDMVKGTDTDGRIGPERSIQRGEITLSGMKKMMVLTAVIISISGSVLVLYATDNFYTIIFILLGVSALTAAVKYTVGKTPYGYRAMGDLFVFIFFGPVGVAGTFFLHTGFLKTAVLLPAVSAGLLSVAVLNLNNMRDAENDLRHGKITFALLLGNRKSRIYHLLLILISVITSVLFGINCSMTPERYFYLISFLPSMAGLTTVLKYKDPAILDPELKKTAMSNLLHSVMLGAALIF